MTLELFDASGRRLDRLFQGYTPAGEQRLTWNASAFPAGQYWVMMAGENGEETRKAVSLVR